MELDPNLPIIVLTGHASQENTIGSLVKGAFAYLTKPYNSQELKAVLRRAVSSKAWSFVPNMSNRPCWQVNSGSDVGRVRDGRHRVGGP